MTRAGQVSGQAFNEALVAEANRSNVAAQRLRSQLEQSFTDAGRRGGRGFGSAFGSELTQSLPGVSGFASAMSGYESAAGKAGAVAGRALGLAFTTAAAGLIGAAGYTLFKGFERYEAIDAAKNRLQNLNATLAQTGRATIDVGRVMETVNQVVEGTPFALDKAFGIATTALSSSTGDLNRFMTAVANTAGFLQAPIDDVGQAFLNVAAKGKISMEELSNQLQGLPLDWLAQTVGVSTGELTKMMEEGKVGLEDLLVTVERNLDGFAKGSVNTVSGAMDQVQTAVARLGANFLGAIFGAPTDDANGLVEALNALQKRIDTINQWVTAHRGDIQEFFRQGAEAVRDLWSALQSVKEILDGLGIGVDDVVRAFIAWKTIQGVSALTTALGGINTMLSTTLPASAATGAAGISAALNRIVLPAWLASMGLNAIDDATGTNVATTIGEIPGSGVWFYDRIFGDKPWNPFGGGGSAPGVLQPGAAGAPSNGFGGSVMAFGGQFQPESLGGPAGAQAERRGGSASPAGPGGPGPAGSPIQPPPGLTDDDGSGKKAPLPVVPFSGDPMSLLEGFAPTSSLFSAAESVLRARHDRAQAESDLNALLASNEQDAEAIQKAKNDIARAEIDINQTELRLREAKQSELDKYNKQLEKGVNDLGQLGAKLDDDFGISEGLAGIAENLTKFLANLAAAPLLGQLGAISAMAPTQGGHGLMGILGAQGAFGPQYQNNQYASQYGSDAMYGPSAMGPAAFGGGLMPGGGGAPSEAQVKQVAAAFGLQVTSEDRPGDPGYHGRGMALDVSNGSGNTPQMRAFAEYMAQNFGSSLKELIYSAPGFSGLIGDGKNVTGTGYYDSGTLADHENHVHIAAEWGSGATSPGGGGGASGLASSLFQDANGQWRSRLPGWDHLIQRESSGINQVQSPSTVDVNTGGNEAEGLFQITPQTWAANGGTRYAPSAITATPQQQAAIAEAIFGANPSGGDWGMGLAGRENPSQLRSELAGFGGGSALPGTGMSQGLPFPQQGGGLPGLTAPGGVGVGSGLGQGLGATPGVGSAARIGGVAPLQGSGQGGAGMTSGGSLDTALSMAASGLDVLAPGAGQAAQTGIKLANRAIQYGGQVAGIMTQGWMDTFLPMGGSKLAQSNWITRLVGGLAGAVPALPNTAGSPGGQPSPEQVAGQPGAQGNPAAAVPSGGDTYNTNITNNHPRDEMGTARDFLYVTQNQGPGM